MPTAKTTAKPPALPDAEIQILADAAVFCWATGVPNEMLDTLGDRWEFEPVRDEASRLVIRRWKRPPPTDETGIPYAPELAGETQVSGHEFGVDEAHAIVASRVLAVANPA